VSERRQIVRICDECGKEAISVSDELIIGGLEFEQWYTITTCAGCMIGTKKLHFCSAGCLVGHFREVAEKEK